MLVSLAEVARAAERRGYAVGAFNTNNLEITQAILAAAEAERSPVILSTTEKALLYASYTLPALITHLAKAVKVPVVLHLDHGRSLRTIRWALAHGYTSVMFDGSHLPFAINLAVTRGLVRLAHTRGISVEGELGKIGGAEDDIKTIQAQETNVEEAKQFVATTRVDLFAPAFGNAHGGKLRSERLNFKLLQEIHRAIKTPLAFHGASETSPRDFKRAISLGVRKINIDTALHKAFTHTVAKSLKAHPEIHDERIHLSAGRDAVTKVVQAHMRLFGSSKKA